LQYSSKDTLRKLEEWQREQAVTSSFLESYKDLLSIQAWAEERLHIDTPSLSRRAVRRRLLSGKPLLKFDEFKIDWHLVNETFKKVVSLFTASPELAGEVPPILSRPEFKLQKRIARAWFNGTALPDDIADEETDGGITKAIIQATMKPFLATYARALDDMIEQNTWRRGYCPVCGGAPDISFLQGEAGERWLMCSRCDTQWRFQRLECPACGNQDHKSLYYLADDSETYRLYACDKCQTYIKAVNLEKAGVNTCLPIERLLTFDMDVQGQNKGYHPLGPKAAC